MNQTTAQLERAIRKVADKFPADKEAILLTDIHLRVSQDTGELVAFDDDDREITRTVIEPWINSSDDDFFASCVSALRRAIEQRRDEVERMSIIKPFAFVLEDDERELSEELFVCDGDTVIIDPDMMPDLDKDLDSFLSDLMKD